MYNKNISTYTYPWVYPRGMIVYVWLLGVYAHVCTQW